MDIARELIEVKRYGEAERILSSVTIAPGSKEALNLMIRLCCECGKMDEAQSLLNLGLEKCLLNTEGCESLACALVKTNPAKVIGVFNASPEKTTKLYNAALSACLLDRSLKMKFLKDLFENAKIRELADIETYRMMLSAYMDRCTFVEAEKFFREASKIDLADAAMYREYVMFCIKKEEYKEAECRVRQAKKRGFDLKLDERTLESLNAKSEKSVLDRVFGPESEEVLYCNLKIRHFLSLGEIEMAREALDDGVKRNIIDTAILDLMIRAYISINEPDNAREIFDMALEHGRTDERMYSILISAYLQHDRFDDAQAMIEKATASGMHQAELYDYFFGKLYTEGRLDKMIKMISEMPPAIQNDPKIAIKRLEALRKMKRYDEAISGADALLGRNGLTDDNRYSITIIKAYSLMHVDKATEALDIFMQLVEFMPESNVSFLRALCGLIFTLKTLDSLDAMSYVSRARTLDYLKHFSGSRGPHLNHDIQDAIDYLDDSIKQNSNAKKKNWTS